MLFLKVSGSYEELGESWQRYRAYLDSVKSGMPRSAFEFASATWHYDHEDHRCLHDSWMEELCITERSAAVGATPRLTEIRVTVLGPFHDGTTTLVYTGVTSYQLGTSSRDGDGRFAAAGHGDWLLDEVRLADDGKVLHEIVFRSGATWTIACADIEYRSSIPDLRSP